MWKKIKEYSSKKANEYGQLAKKKANEKAIEIKKYASKKADEIKEKAKKEADKQIGKAKKEAKKQLENVKNYPQKVIRDNKRRIAVQVIDETKDKVKTNEQKLHLKAAQNLIKDKFEKGGEIKSRGLDNIEDTKSHFGYDDETWNALPEQDKIDLRRKAHKHLMLGKKLMKKDNAFADKYPNSRFYNEGDELEFLNW